MPQGHKRLTHTYDAFKSLSHTSPVREVGLTFKTLFGCPSHSFFLVSGHLWFVVDKSITSTRDGGTTSTYIACKTEPQVVAPSISQQNKDFNLPRCSVVSGTEFLAADLFSPQTCGFYQPLFSQKIPQLLDHLR